MILTPNIRLAEAGDARAMAQMSRQYVEQGLGWSWTEGRVLGAIRSRACNVAVVRERARLAAFGIMQYADDKAHLALLCVHPGRRRRRLGTQLLAWLEKCADTAGIGCVLLEARADNEAALAFYEHLGYRSTGRISGYYRGVLDAVKLEKRLWAEPQVEQ
jgi:ribosomal-protein-alanine N-acetyltransferase